MDKIVQQEVTVTARGDKMTLFLRGWAQWPMARNDFFWSDIKIYRVSAPQPQPEDLKPYVKSSYRLRTSPSSDNTDNIMLVTSSEVPVVIKNTDGGWDELSVFVKHEGIIYK